MRALAILFLVPGFSLGLVAGVTHLVGPIDPVSPQQTSLVWSNRVFPTREDFATWLVSRGSNYDLWSQRHPAAARHFDDPSLDASSSVQPSRSPVQSTTALLIAIISFAVLLAMLALPRFVRSARFLLNPPNIGLRLRGPPLALVGVAKAQSRGHALRPPRPSLLSDTVRFDTLRRLGRVAPSRAALATRSNSRLVRHYLPRVIFYAAAVVVSFVIGAWIAIYLP